MSNSEYVRHLAMFAADDYEKARNNHMTAMGHPTKALLPTEPAARKRIPIWSGVIKYFPDAIIEIAKVSLAGNEQHNPGQPLHWAREKSTDQEDTIMRHLMEAGSVDSDGQRHTAKAAWRILAKLQLELEAANDSKT
jgi:hypothetical protein